MAKGNREAAGGEAIMSQVPSRQPADAEIQRHIQEHISYIEAAAKRVLGPAYTQVLDELCQEVSIAIWRVLEKDGSVQHWKAFIYHCAHKRALDMLRHARRKARREVSLGELTDEDDEVAESQLALVSTPGDDLNQALTILDEELAKLPPLIRLTVVLRKGEGYSRAEVAQMLGCSPATVDYRLREGLHHLRRRLRQRGLQHYLG